MPTGRVLFRGCAKIFKSLFFVLHSNWVGKETNYISSIVKIRFVGAHKALHCKHKLYHKLQKVNLRVASIK